jgi:hypothetical protein
MAIASHKSRSNLVIAKVKRSVDWLERLKVDIHFLLFTILGCDSTTVDNEAVGWYLTDASAGDAHYGNPHQMLKLNSNS